MKKALFIRILVCLLLMVGVFGLSGCNKDSTTNTYTSLDALLGKKIAVLPDGAFEEAVSNYYGSNVNVLEFNNFSDEIEALKAGKVDAVANDLPSVKELVRSDSSLTYIPELLEENDYAAMCSLTDDGYKLSVEFSTFLASYRAKGTLEQIQNIWFGEDDNLKVVTDPTTLEATKGTLNVGVVALYSPMAYIVNDTFVGYEVGLVTRFCQEAGYGLVFHEVDGSNIINELYSNDTDMVIGSISVTEARKKTCNFSSATYTGGVTLVVLSNKLEKTSIWSELIEKFNATFIEEDRYKLFLEGLGNTLLISFVSMIAGILIGLLIFMLMRLNIKGVNWIIDKLSWVVQGLPEIVLLLVAYYLIFGSSSMGGVWISIITFTFIFSISFSVILMDGFKTVGTKQIETAFSLGFGRQGAYRYIIMPQAIKNILPQLKSAGISHIKATAVVGYIAVHDLTKVSDIIRSRSFDAFYSLVTTGIIYLLIEMTFSIFMNVLMKKTDKHMRSKEYILRGVKIEK